MPQRIDIPGQGIVEFPDEMDDAAISAAAKRLAAPPQPTAAPTAPEPVGVQYAVPTPQPIPEFAPQVVTPEPTLPPGTAAARQAAAGYIPEAIQRPAAAIGEFIKEQVAPPPNLTQIAFGPAVQPVAEPLVHAAEVGRELYAGKPVAEAVQKVPEIAGIRELTTAKPFSPEWWRAAVPLGVEAAQFALPFLPKVARLGRLTETVFPKAAPEAAPPTAPIPSITERVQPEVPVAREPVREELQPRGGEISATQERQIQEGVPVQRPGDVQGRPPAEAGVGGGVQPAAEVGRPPAPEAPVAEGYVRLYHGSSEASPQAGRDFTPSREYAQGYADKAEGGGKVWYVDVPEGTLKTHDEYGQPISRVIVPDEIANQAKPISAAEAPAAAREAPPIQPPAEAPPAAEAAPAPQPDTVTGIANKVTQQERAARGIPEATEPERRSWQQAMDEAQRRDAEGPNLVAELKNNPRALSDTEDALVLREQIKAQQAHDAAVKEVNANPGDEAAKARLEAARDRVQMIYDLDKSVGTVAGRGFNARKMLADQDFTLANMEATSLAEASGGKPLDPLKRTTILNRVGKYHKDIERTEAAYQKQLRKAIEEYKRRTGEKDVSPLRPPKRVATDPTTVKLLHERDKARKVYRDLLSELRFNAAPLYRKIGHYASDIGVGLSRSIKSAFDLSGLLRQGGLIVAGRPVTGARAIGPMLKAFASEEAQTAAMQDIVSHAKYDRMRNSKLEITEPGGRMSSREEVFRSSLAEHIPGVKASERAYTTVLNKLRADSFDALTGLAEKMTGRKLTPGEDKLFANYINIASGRGAMGRFAPAANALSKFFWSPRLAVSRVQYLAGQPIWGNLKAGGAPAVRALIAAEYARTLTGMAVMVGLAKAAGADVELDPRSGNFGIRFGNTRIDITAGLKSYINFFSRIITNKIKTQKGEIKTLGQDVVTPKAGELTWKMLRGKLAPAYGSGFNVLEHELPTGEPTTLINELLGFYAPLSPQDVGDALQTQGMPQKTALSLLAIGGMSVQNYEHMSAADKNAIRARLEQRDQALMRGDVNTAFRLSLPSTKPAGSPTVTKVMR